MTIINIQEIELSGAPNKNYETFFIKCKSYSNTPVVDWKVNQLIGYFCNKYKNRFNTEFKFKFNSSSPSKCFEVFQIKKLSMNLTSDPTLLKEYIDWIFEKANKKFTSISYLTKEEYIQFYKMNVLLGSTISRSKELPEKYKELLTEYSILTYGDLAFLFASKSSDDNILKAIESIKAIGFNEEDLKKIV